MCVCVCGYVCGCGCGGGIEWVRGVCVVVGWVGEGVV